jgi:quinol monooxygenase YgiN
MMLGQAALAMWWDMAPGMRDEFEHWHSHEHFPERLALPGFLRASRWADRGGGEGFFVMYELAEYEVLVSPEYVARLNAPSEWSRRMMPHHRHMVRSQCRVLESRGGVVAGHAVTVRLSPVPGRDDPLRSYLHALVEELPARPGFIGAHLLKTDTPAIAQTTEQKIRTGADDAADWIFIANGYDAQALQRLTEGELSHEALQAAGAAPGATTGAYELRLSMVAADAR